MPRPAKLRSVGGKRCSRTMCSDIRVSQGQESTHYEALGVPSTASTAEIHMAYKRRALTTHPDKGGTAEEFQRVSEAFQVLSDTASRERYDQQEILDCQGNPPSSRGVSCPRRAQGNVHAFYEKLAQLLQRMSSSCRRDIIMQRLSSSLRAGLEKHMQDEKAKTCSSASSSELCPVEMRCGTGIYRASRAGGYYAKVFVASMGLQGCTHKQLADAVSDHVALMKVVENLRHSYFELDKDHRAVPSNLQATLPPGLVTSVQVFFYNRHFIGHRHLQLNFKTLTEGLEAWEAMQKAKGPTLFTGNGVTDAYSPDSARQQWQSVKEAYLHYASGRRSSRAEIEQQLALWEKDQMPIRVQREFRIWQRQTQKKMRAQPSVENESGDQSLKRSLDRLLRQQAKLVEAPEFAEEQRTMLKRKQNEPLREIVKSQKVQVQSV